LQVIRSCCKGSPSYFVARGLEVILDHGFAFHDELHRGGPLLIGHAKEVLHMPERDDQHVPLAHRVPVPEGVAEVVFGDDLFGEGGAEGAGICIPIPSGKNLKCF
jgi:hypothetical protein